MKSKQSKLTGKKKKLLDDSDDDNFEFDEPIAGPSTTSKSRTTRGNKIQYNFEDSDNEGDDVNEKSYQIEISDDDDDDDDDESDF